MSQQQEPSEYPYQGQTNTGPREQQAWNAPARNNEKIHPVTTRRKRNRGCLHTLVIAVVLFCIMAVLGGGALGYVHIPGLEKTTSSTYTFASTEIASLIMQNNAGNIHIHSGSGSQVIVNATKRTSGLLVNPDDIQLHYSQSSDERSATINIDFGNSFLNNISSRSVDIDITVPKKINLNISENAGKVEIDNVKGSISLASNASTVTLTNDTLTGNSAIKTNAASITMSSALALNSHTQIIANAGAIIVKLPADSAVHVGATADAGSVSSTIAGINISRSFARAEGQGDIGSDIQNTSLNIHANAGDIKIQQQ